MPGTSLTANLVQFFKFPAPYIKSRLEKVATFFCLVSKMVKSKHIKLGKRFVCSLYKY